MSLIFNNTEVDSVIYNGVELDEIIFNGVQVYVSGPKPYLKFKATKQFTLKTYNGNKRWDGVIEYSTDANNWLTWDGSAISSSENGLLFLRGINNTYIYELTDPCLAFTLDGTLECEGNIENLLDYSSVQNGIHPSMGPNCFRRLFAYCSQLTKAPELPAISLVSSCYMDMFQACSRLTSAPVLSAVSLSWSCYTGMFKGTGITVAPSLPASVLVQGCYQTMFYSTPLISAPRLSATTLAPRCYSAMFRDCYSLTAIPALPALNLEANCYAGMFSNCIKLKLASASTTTYTQSYRIPISGEGVTATNALYNMFTTTGGTFKGTPTINTTYYLDSSNTIIPA